MIEKIGTALHYAHQQGLIHWDVKPGNIVLDQQGEPKLTDFDLVKVEDSELLTTQHEMLDTAVYAAPELLTMPGRVDQRADLYGLAITAVLPRSNENRHPRVAVLSRSG